MLLFTLRSNNYYACCKRLKRKPASYSGKKPINASAVFYLLLLCFGSLMFMERTLFLTNLTVANNSREDFNCMFA